MEGNPVNMRWWELASLFGNAWRWGNELVIKLALPAIKHISYMYILLLESCKVFVSEIKLKIA